MVICDELRVPSTFRKSLPVYQDKFLCIRDDWKTHFETCSNFSCHPSSTWLIWTCGTHLTKILKEPSANFKHTLCIQMMYHIDPYCIVNRPTLNFTAFGAWSRYFVASSGRFVKRRTWSIHWVVCPGSQSPPGSLHISSMGSL